MASSWVEKLENILQGKGQPHSKVVSGLDVNSDEAKKCGSRATTSNRCTKFEKCHL